MTDPTASSNPPSGPQSPTDSLGNSPQSQVSIGFGGSPDDEAYPGPVPGPRPPPLIRIASDKDVPLRDRCCAIVYCKSHDRFLLTASSFKSLFLPSFAVDSIDQMEGTEMVTCWVIKLLQTELGAPATLALSPVRLFECSRVQVPGEWPRFSVRLIYVTSITKCEPVCVCSTQSSIAKITGDLFRWITLDELKQEADTLWGPEPWFMFNKLHESLSRSDGDQQQQKWLVHKEETDQADLTDPVLTGPNASLVFSAGFGTDTVMKLANEYVCQCLPARSMTWASFRVFMHKLGWFEEDDSLVKRLFVTFVAAAISASSDVSTGQTGQPRPIPYLSLAELVMGLATIEETADNREHNLHLRLQFLFHFYDADRDFGLNKKELTSLAEDILRFRKDKDKPLHPVGSQIGPQPSQIRESGSSVRSTLTMLEQSPTSTTGEDEVIRLVSEMCLMMTKQSSMTDTSAPVTVEQFTTGVRSSVWLAELIEPLFRSNRSTARECVDKFDYTQSGPQCSTTKLLKAQVMLAGHNRHQTCGHCGRTTKFEICSHGIRVGAGGRIMATIKFDLCPDFADIAFRQEVQVKESTFDCIVRFARYVSQLSSPTDPDRASATVPRPTAAVKTELANMFGLVKQSLDDGVSIVHLGTPCLVIGQVLSNTETLHHLKTSLDQWQPFMTPMNMVLLGNFLDPNHPQSVDTLVYLLGLKTLMPKRVHLLRGAKEFPNSLASSKLHKDFVKLYGESNWKQAMEMLDSLPAGAVVDHSILLTPSGIPPGTVTTVPPNSASATNASARTVINSLALCKPYRGPSKTRTTSSTTSNAPCRSSTARKGSSMGSGNSKQKPSKSTTHKNRKQSSTANSKSNKAAAPPVTSKSHQKTSKTASDASLTPSLTPSSGSSQFFTGQDLRRFLRANGYSHVIRSEQFTDEQPFRLSACGTVITLGDIGRQMTEDLKTTKLIGALALINRFQIQLIRLEANVNGTQLF